MKSNSESEAPSQQHVPGVTEGGVAKKKNRNGPRSRSSPYLGVSQIKGGKYKHILHWEAHIWDSTAEGGSGRQLHLGSFLTAEQAAKAYDRAALLFRGPHAELNQPASAYANDPELEKMRGLSKRDQVMAIRQIQADPLPMATPPAMPDATATEANASTQATSRPAPPRPKAAAKKKPAQRPASSASAPAATTAGSTPTEAPPASPRLNSPSKSGLASSPQTHTRTNSLRNARFNKRAAAAAAAATSPTAATRSIKPAGSLAGTTARIPHVTHLPLAGAANTAVGAPTTAAKRPAPPKSIKPTSKSQRARSAPLDDAPHASSDDDALLKCPPVLTSKYGKGKPKSALEPPSHRTDGPPSSPTRSGSTKPPDGPTGPRPSAPGVRGKGTIMSVASILEPYHPRSIVQQAGGASPPAANATTRPRASKKTIIKLGQRGRAATLDTAALDRAAAALLCPVNTDGKDAEHTNGRTQPPPASTDNMCSPLSATAMLQANNCWVLPFTSASDTGMLLSLPGTIPSPGDRNKDLLGSPFKNLASSPDRRVPGSQQLLSDAGCDSLCFSPAANCFSPANWMRFQPHNSLLESPVRNSMPLLQLAGDNWQQQLQLQAADDRELQSPAADPAGMLSSRPFQTLFPSSQPQTMHHTTPAQGNQSTDTVMHDGGDFMSQDDVCQQAHVDQQVRQQQARQLLTSSQSLHGLRLATGNTGGPGSTGTLLVTRRPVATPPSTATTRTQHFAAPSSGGGIGIGNQPPSTASRSVRGGGGSYLSVGPGSGVTAGGSSGAYSGRGPLTPMAPPGMKLYGSQPAPWLADGSYGSQVSSGFHHHAVPPSWSGQQASAHQRLPWDTEQDMHLGGGGGGGFMSPRGGGGMQGVGVGVGGTRYRSGSGHL